MWGFNHGKILSRGVIRFYSTSNGNPLKVLFFGSDQYSSHSLNALHSLLRTKDIDSLQVVTRSPKSCGRYLSEVRKVPIMSVNDSLGLPPVIKCDTRSDLLGLIDNPSVDFNVLIAVSFGKLIPKQLIEKVHGKAFNIHPSLLPRYRGSSPIQYTLLNRDEFTGVTIQSLHPTKFDHGKIIKQTAPLSVQEILKLGTVSKFDEDVPEKVATLMDQLGLKSGELLQQMIRERDFNPKPNPNYEPSLAPKITTEMKQITWNNERKLQLLAKNDALGSLHSYKLSLPKRKKEVMKKRIIFPELYDLNETISMKPGEFKLSEDENTMIIQCIDGQIGTNALQFEGFALEPVPTFVNRLNKRCGKMNSNEFL
ncbi:Fmt1 [Kluyveromyces lactis]|nr:Fmt1 [Kluyveromyces lactis]